MKEEAEPLKEASLDGGYSMKKKHESKYRIHAPNGEHVGDITKEPGTGKWRHHAGGSKWDGSEDSPHYKTGVSDNAKEAAKKVAQIHMKEEAEQVHEGSDTLPVQKMTSSYGLGRRKPAEVATQG